MLCFRDMSFCTAKCATQHCDRKLTDQIKRDAEAWWPENPAIATSDFSLTCAEFKDAP